MKTRLLSTPEKALTGADVALTLDYNDVAAATSTVAVNSYTVLAGHKVQVVGMKLNTAFDISGSGDLTISVGDGGSATALMAAVQVAVDGTEILYHVGGSAKVYLVDDTVDVFWTAASMAYTSGSLTLYLRVENMNEWPVAA